MQNEFSRSARVLGPESLQKLSHATVAIFGIGGVGSYAAEAIARGGVGNIVLIDNDIVSISNINRQLVALHSTVGQPKVAVMKARINDINPQANVTAHQLFYTAETACQLDISTWDFIIDAIDTVSSKLILAKLAQAAAVPIISCMGTGNKLDPAQLEIDDISHTSMCPLAKVMRLEARKQGISKLTVVYSKEEPRTPIDDETAPPQGRRQVPGSLSFVPPVAGMLAAGHVIRELTGAVKK